MERKKKPKPARLEVMTEEEYLKFFDELIGCPICDNEDRRYLEQIEFVKDFDNKEYYKITYSCGHRRLREIVRYHK